MRKRRSVDTENGLQPLSTERGYYYNTNSSFQLAKFSQDVALICPHSNWCHNYRQFVLNRLIDASKYTSLNIHEVTNMV